MALANIIGKTDLSKISKSFGTFGQAALNNSKPLVIIAANNNDPVSTQEISINKPIVKMIQVLASIDGFLKQQLENQKIISNSEALEQREASIEQKSQEPEILVSDPEADAEKTEGSRLGGLLALGGLGLLAYEPVQDAIKQIIDGVKSVATFVTDMARSINSAFDFILSDEETSKTLTKGAPAAEPAAPATSEQATPAPTPEPAPTPAPAGNERAARTVAASIGGAVGLGMSVISGLVSGGESTPEPAPTPSAGRSAERVRAQPTGPMGDFAANFKDPVPGGSWSGPGLGLPRDGGARRHQGIDIFAPTGTPVYAAADGEVEYSEQRPTGGFGIAVKLRHPGGYVTKYAHLSGLSGYRRGDRVRAGDVIGYVGDTGNARGTPPHLHFEIWRNNTMQEPANYLSGASQTGYAPDTGMGYAPDGGLAENITNMAQSGLETVARMFGALGSAIIGPRTARNDIPNTIAVAARELNTTVAASRTETPPTPPTLPSPPRINRRLTRSTQNPPTMEDRNSVYYYLQRFGYNDLRRPEAVVGAAS